MDKDFMQYVYARIEKVLSESEKYSELQKKCIDAYKNNDLKLYSELNTESDSISEELCYLQGFRDAINLITNHA